MKKIVELVVKIGDLEFDDVHVDAVAMVEKPAIELPFFAFSEEEFVEPEAGESKDEFMGRCIPTLIDEGYDQDQAAAICYSYYDEKQFVEHQCSTHDTDIEIAQNEFLKLAEAIGESYDPTTITYIDLTQDRFSNIGDFMKGLGALDLLNRNSIRKEKKGRTMYRYAGPTPGSNSRNFCKAMFNMNKLYTRANIQQMRGLNSDFGHNGNAYSIFAYKGGPFCQHYWEELTVFEGQESGKLIFLSHGPADGRAGMAPQEMPGGGRYGFSTVDEEQRIVVGPVLVANKLIKRIDRKTGEEYFVYFSEKTVRDVAELLFKRNLQNRTNIEHASTDTDTHNTLLEQWIVDDPELDKSRLYGFEVPKGTLMQMRKINNEATWERIKSGELKGFSVEGSFLERIAQEQEIATEDQQLSAILDILKNIED